MFRRLINTSYLLGGDLLTLALVDLWPRRRVDIGCSVGICRGKSTTMY